MNARASKVSVPMWNPTYSGRPTLSEHTTSKDWRSERRQSLRMGAYFSNHVDDLIIFSGCLRVDTVFTLSVNDQGNSLRAIRVQRQVDEKHCVTYVQLRVVSHQGISDLSAVEPLTRYVAHHVR